MSVVMPDPTKLHNGIAHSVLQSDGSKPLSNERREELRAEYRLLLDRANQVTAHKSGWCAMIEWESNKDSERAEEIRNEMFITGSVHPSQIAAALSAIFAE